MVAGKSTKKTGKGKKRKGEERHLLHFLETRLSKLPPIKLNESNPKYGLLANEDKPKGECRESEDKSKRTQIKNKGKHTRANQPELASFFRKPSDNTPQTPTVRITRRIDTPHDTEYTVQWDNVTFEERYLVIKGVVPHKTIDLFYKPAQASFNFIKRRIKQRLQPFKIQISDGQARLLDSLYIGEVVEYLECRDWLEQMLDKGQCDYSGYYDRIPPHLSSLFLPKDKKEYLDILCDLQSDNHKIIPVSEAIGETIEDSFLFTIEREATMYVIWENTNVSRATYLFRVNREEYDQRLQFLFDYIVSDIRAKRQRLHSDSIDKERLGDFEIINHTDVGAWRERLNIY
jgi:hypothetical protein